MMEEIRNWENERDEDVSYLIIFSDGDPEQHKNLDIDSTIVLDERYANAQKLGMFSTPSAVLVNEEGVIATETAIGSENIWALIGKRK